MDGERRLRHLFVDEDADDGSLLEVPEPEDPGEAPPERERELVELRYRDMHPWRCAECNQAMLPEWHRCSMCGQLREDCEE